MILQPSDVEAWIRAAHPFPHYTTREKRVDQFDKTPPRVHVTTWIEGPNGERIEGAVYYTLENPSEVMPQAESEWVA